MSEAMVIALISAVVGIAGSSGIWTYLQRRSDKNSTMARMVMGLTYDKILSVGMTYIHRGWISKDEYEDYLKYFVEPYKEMGGNGVADRMARDVGTLPFRAMQFVEVIIKEGSENEAQ